MMLSVLGPLVNLAVSLLGASEAMRAFADKAREIDTLSHGEWNDVQEPSENAFDDAWIDDDDDDRAPFTGGAAARELDL